MNRTTLASVGLLLVAAVGSSSACTIFVEVKPDTVLVGNNLDESNFVPRLWFVPDCEGQYARFCFGFDENFRIAEGGMNDQGLYISVNALGKDTGWKSDPSLPDWEQWSGWYQSGVPDGILAKCATVEEAIEVFRGYNLFTLGKVKFLVADKTGASAVIEWSGGHLRFLRRPDAKTYQISTNFVQSDYAPTEIPCERYRIAEMMLDGGRNRHSIDGFRGILSATHLEFMTPTVYSNICNLNTGDIYVYYFHNFEEPVRMNLHEALKGGRTERLVRDLFCVRPYVATLYEARGTKQ